MKRMGYVMGKSLDFLWKKRDDTSGGEKKKCRAATTESVARSGLAPGQNFWQRQSGRNAATSASAVWTGAGAVSLAGNETGLGEGRPANHAQWRDPKFVTVRPK